MTRYKQIKSVKDESTPKSWYGVEISNGEPEIVADNDGGLSATVTGTANVPSFVDLPDPAQGSMSTDVVYAVTTDGEFIAYEKGTELSQHGVSLRAHLAWYDSAADEFTVLEFVEQ